MKNVAADKKYILRKMDLKSQNPKFNISCKIAFYMLLLKNVKPLEFRGQLGHSKTSQSG